MMEHILRSSMENETVITIIYAKGSVITRRNVQVLSMNGTVVKAFCYLRGQLRLFKRENILAADYCRFDRTAGRRTVKA